MATCDECGFDWTSAPADTIAEIARINSNFTTLGRDATRSSTVDTDRMLRTRPPSGGWPSCEYLAHVRDVLDFYTDRLELVLTTHRPPMTATDFATLADQARYNDEDINIVLLTISERASAASRRLAWLVPSEWGRVGIGSSGGERSVLDLARRLAHEGRHHHVDVQRVLREIYLR